MDDTCKTQQLSCDLLLCPPPSVSSSKEKVSPLEAWASKIAQAMFTLATGPAIFLYIYISKSAISRQDSQYFNWIYYTQDLTCNIQTHPKYIYPETHTQKITPVTLLLWQCSPPPPHTHTCLLLASQTLLSSKASSLLRLTAQQG